MFTFKKWFKKICLFSASASLACCFCSPLANAAEPGANTKGKLVGNTSISEDSDTTHIPTAQITLGTLTYTGLAQNIISSINSVTLNGNQISDYISEKAPHLWLRVADAQGNPTAQSDWVRYTGAESGEGSLSDTNLQRTNAGTYYVYYYIDGNNNCPDSGSDGENPNP